MSAVAFVVLVVGRRRTGIPPPVGIVESVVGIGVIEAAPKAEAIVAESIEVIVATTVVVMQERAIRKRTALEAALEEGSLREGGSAGETARRAWRYTHSARNAAATETGMTGEAAHMPTAETGVSATGMAAATLGYYWHRRQQQDERRNR